MSRARGRLLIPVLAIWIVSILAAAGYYFLLFQVAPEVLERDRNTSVWYLNSLADEAWREFRELPTDASSEKKATLLGQAAVWLSEAHRLRPDSSHYLWYLALTQHQLAKVRTPPDEALRDESIQNIERVLFMTDRKWSRPLIYLAHHFVDLKEDEQAKPLYEEILGLNEGDTEALDGLMQIAYRAGDYVEYTRLFEAKSVSAHPSPEERETLATIALRYEDYDRASVTLSDLFASGGATKDRWFLYAVANVGRKDLREVVRSTGMCLLDMKAGEAWPSPADLGLRKYPDHLPEWVAYSLLEAYVQEEVTQ